MKKGVISPFCYSLKNNETEIERLLVDMEQANKVISQMEIKLSFSKQDVLSDMLSSIQPIINFLPSFLVPKIAKGIKLRMN